MMISTLIINLMLVLWPIYLPMITYEYERPCVTTGDALEKAIAYLEHCEFNGKVGLIRESPEPADNDACPAFPRYWLATDNRVAQYALDSVNADTLASILDETLQRYPNHSVHGIVEVLNGDDIDIPPNAAVQREVEVQGDAKICNEERSGNSMHDWEDYADLLLYGSLDAFYSGDMTAAKDRYNQAIIMFDGNGFADRFFCTHPKHLHPTYKLALAIYTAHVIGQPEPKGARAILLAQQESLWWFCHVV